MILETEDDIEVIGEAADGRSGLDLVRVKKPDVVLMDVRMPIMDGGEATRRLEANDHTRVIIVTTFDLDEYVFAALRYGASGFLLKDTPADQLVAAVRVVATGEALLSPSVTKRLIEKFQTAEGGADPTESKDNFESLTDREAEVLTEMARGLSNAEIGEKLFVSETTVKTHVGRVLTKLNVRDRVQAVVMAYESGVVRPGHQ
ncbi:MAG: LuxR C-terminal-related transcriptional regulator [Acidimicrobiales bacterium]